MDVVDRVKDFISSGLSDCKKKEKGLLYSRGMCKPVVGSIMEWCSTVRSDGAIRSSGISLTITPCSLI